MTGSILDAFNDALSKLKANEKARTQANEKVHEAGHVHKFSESEPSKDTSNSLPAQSQNVVTVQRNRRDETEDVSVKLNGKKQKRRASRGSYGPVISSLLPGAPRTPAQKKTKLKPPLVFTVPRYIHLRDSQKAKFLPPEPKTEVTLSPNADLVWNGGYDGAFQLLNIDERSGIPEQLPTSSGRDRELVIGLDFGTSTVKVVIGDRGASKAYAVPFVDATGVNQFLLPSRLFEKEGVFSLSDGENVHRDLKLRFLANSKFSPLQETLVGFLALVIRRCRAWLFKEHADSLSGRNILWKLVIGRAVDRNQFDLLGQTLERILCASWDVAGNSSVISRGVCGRALQRLNTRSESTKNSLEVSVVPELAAQIYGFVKSRQFDPRAKNFYLFVDVGAGTVDTSLFRVKTNEFGSWDFSLFTSVVEPNGVMNLHRFRLDWWRRQLKNLSSASIETILQKVEGIALQTEQTQLIPEKYDGYFKGVQAKLSGGALDPDETFYLDRLVQQVRGRGIHRTVQTRIVGRPDLDHLPFFLCGGGSRLSLYKNISLALDGAPEFRWLRAHRKELGVPGELEAKGLAQVDYDRLSVAYGLSFVDVGTVAIAKAMPAIKQRSSGDWRSSYTGKDVC
jgi:hypothetical protein